MGYFDALTGSSFKTAPDGRKLFFPWGTLGRGYVVGSENEYERLRHQIKIYLIIGLPLLVAAQISLGLASSLVVLALLLAFYSIWMQYLLRRLQPSDERLLLRESLSSQAHAHSPIFLWFAEIASLAFVGAGILILILKPGNWLVAIASITFFGLCAAFITRMLIIRGRT